MSGICGFCRKYKENVTLHQNQKYMCYDCWQEYHGVPKKKEKLKLFETHFPDLMKELFPRSLNDLVVVVSLCLAQSILLTIYFCRWILDLIDNRFLNENGHEHPYRKLRKKEDLEPGFSTRFREGETEYLYEKNKKDGGIYDIANS